MTLGLLQATPTATPGAGAAELVKILPAATRIGWFFVGLLGTTIVGWYLIDPVVSRAVRKRNPDNPTIQEAVSRYLRLLMIVIGAFIGAALAGYGGFVSDSALVIAAVTLAIGVAGQTIIGSIFSGLVLVTDPEFNVGNYITWADGEGIVQSITLRVTRVETPDGGLVTIPNTVLTGQAITRPYSRRRRRMTERVGIAYGDDVDAALERLRETAQELDGIRGTPKPDAYVDEFGEDAVLLRVHYWIDDPRSRDVLAVKSAFARDAKRRLEHAGITISPASKRELWGQIDVTGHSNGGNRGDRHGADDER